MQTQIPSSQRPTRVMPAIAIDGPGDRPLEEQYPARDPAGPPDVQPDAEFPRAAAGTGTGTIVPPVNPNVEQSPTYPDGDGLEHTKTDNPPRDRQGIDGEGHWSK